MRCSSFQVSNAWQLVQRCGGHRRCGRIAIAQRLKLRSHKTAATAFYSAARQQLNGVSMSALQQQQQQE